MTLSTFLRKGYLWQSDLSLLWHSVGLIAIQGASILPPSIYLCLCMLRKEMKRKETCNIPLTTLQDFGFTCFCDPSIWLIAGVGFGEGELVKSGDSRTSTPWFMELGRITQGLLNLLDVSLMHVMLYHIIIMAVTIKLSELWLVETRLPGICTWVTNSH